ncbi:MAG TPA: sialidase family protein [Anaerolineales bacterium]|nr:sialidase family protein [Anaerolineales bacterium]
MSAQKRICTASARILLVALVIALLTPAPALSGSSTLRIDPEALSGRIAQYLLGETESESGSSKAGVVFGENTRLSDEHIPRRLISQTEPAIAVNPADGQNLVAGFHDLFPKTQDFVCRFAFTADGGQTWNLGGAAPLQTSGNFCSDPALAADAQGNFYYAYLDINFGATRSDIDVAKSTDGGQTFATFSIAVHGHPSTNFPDKEFIAVDTSPASPFQGAIYLSWTDFLNPTDPLARDNGQIKVVVSRDGGATWSDPLAISESAQFPKAISGSLPVVAADGTAYVFYADFTANTGPLSIKFSKSTDGGETWSAPADVASDLASPGRFRLKNADPAFGSVPGRGFRSNSFPTAAIAPDGTIYVAWIDFPDGLCVNDRSGRPPCVNSDVRLAVSTDGGASWTDPVKVTDERNATDQFFPWIAAHPGGRLSIIWQDKRLDPNNVDFDTFYTSTTNGRAFRPDVRISTATSRAGLTTFIGDYNYLAVTSSGIFPVWTDRRFRNNDIFTVTGSLHNP